MRRFFRDDRGASAGEYVLVLALFGGAVTGGALALGISIGGAFHKAAAVLDRPWAAIAGGPAAGDDGAAAIAAAAPAGAGPGGAAARGASAGKGSAAAAAKGANGKGAGKPGG